MPNGGQSVSSSSSFHFVAGLGSGLLSSILLQPADLLKTRLQQSGSNSLITTIREVARSPNGLRAFWRGAIPSALRTGLGSALYFSSLNVLRQAFAKSSISNSIGAHSHSSALPKLSNLGNLATGAIARASAGFVLMPMTVIKVRYESTFYGYRSIAGACKDIFLTEGFRGFFSGFGATALRDAPYAGLYVVLYEQSKKRLSLLSQGNSETSRSKAVMRTSTSTSINFASGVIAAGLATAITNPFDAIKTRIQLQPKEYGNIIHAARKMIRNDGIKSMFDGLGLRMSRKALSSALAWTLYEELIRRAEMTLNAHTREDGTISLGR